MIYNIYQKVAMNMKQFEARQRTAVDGIVWWCVFDVLRRKWSTLTCHGQYKTKREAEYAIRVYGMRGWY